MSQQLNPEIEAALANLRQAIERTLAQASPSGLAFPGGQTLPTLAIPVSPSVSSAPEPDPGLAPPDYQAQPRATTGSDLPYPDLPAPIAGGLAPQPQVREQAEEPRRDGDTNPFLVPGVGGLESNFFAPAQPELVSPPPVEVFPAPASAAEPTPVTYTPQVYHPTAAPAATVPAAPAAPEPAYVPGSPGKFAKANRLLESVLQKGTASHET